MSLLRRLLPLALLACLLAAGPARARSSQEVTFEAPRDLYDAGQRDAALATLDGLGVHALRVVLYWHDVAPSPDARVKPAMDMTDPATYDWSKYQAAISDAARRGWRVQLTLSGPVPRWATNGARDTRTRPSPDEFRAFVSAAARRFGSEVTRWSIWNEPNHPDFLAPQYDSGKRPVSPTIYRHLYAAALKGLADAGDAKPVLMGETAPVGTGKDVAPLTFLRGALCLDARYRKDGDCSRLRVDGYAHHAYTTKQGPRYVPRGPNDVTIGVLSRLTKALDRAASAGVVRRRLPIYLTEFGIQSVPDPLYGVSLQQQNEYRAYSERIAYDNPRVAAFSQYLLTDDAPRVGGSSLQRYSGFESGLRTSGGKDKPALAGFRLPVVARKGRSGRSVSLWGLVRPATAATQVVLQTKDRGRGWKTAATLTTGASGVWKRSSSAQSGREWRVTWTSPSGETFTSPGVRAY